MLEIVTASTASGPVWLALLVGGGLGLVGTLAGALATQWNATRLDREARREARRMAVKTYQRETLVELQDAVLSGLGEHHRFQDAPDDPSAQASYEAAELRVRMLASRVRDAELRDAVEELLQGWQGLIEVRRAGEKFPTRTVLQQVTGGMRAIYERAGALIRTLDDIDTPD